MHIYLDYSVMNPTDSRDEELYRKYGKMTVDVFTVPG